jgi:hypothetical protein
MAHKQKEQILGLLHEVTKELAVKQGIGHE